MKSFRILLITLSILAVNLHVANAQEDETQEGPSLDNGSIESQFEYLTTKSGNYRADGKKYEVVREIWLEKIRQNVLDTVKVYAKKVAELKSTIITHEATIEGLNKKLEDTAKSLAAVTEEKDSMSFLGILVSKGAYNTLLWTIIGSLLGLLLFFVYKFRNSNILTQEAKTTLSEVEAEYEDHRRRALEREQKISRQLQDEINKHKKSK